MFPRHHTPPLRLPILVPEGTIPSAHCPDCLLIPIPHTHGRETDTFFCFVSGGYVSGTLTTVASTFRTWGSLWAMLPRGGGDIWGGSDFLGAPDDALGVPGENKTQRVRVARFPNPPHNVCQHKTDPFLFYKQGETGVESADRFNAKHTDYFISLREETEQEAAEAGQALREEWVNDTPTEEVVSNDAAISRRLREGEKQTRESNRPKNLTVTDSLKLLFDRVGKAHPRNLAEYRDVSLGEGLLGEELTKEGVTSRSWGFGDTQTQKNDHVKPSSVKFGDPLRVPLPNAPKLKIFCLYGVGKQTERAYHYVKRVTKQSEGNGNANGDRPYALDVTVNEKDRVDRGVVLTDGDGSIPLISLGYVCADAWRDGSLGWGNRGNRSDDSHKERKRRDFVSHLNPGGAVVKIREYEHKPIGVWNGGMQEGPQSGDHVNIMGNVDMIRDVIDAVTGHGAALDERVVSDVFLIAANARSLRLARRKKEREGGKDEL